MSCRAGGLRLPRLVCRTRFLWLFCPACLIPATFYFV